MKKKETKRISMNLPVDLMKKIEVYANLSGLNKTSAMIVILNNGLKGKKI